MDKVASTISVLSSLRETWKTILPQTPYSPEVVEALNYAIDLLSKFPNLNWETAPDWANWLAQDADGSWYWYEIMPEPLTDVWKIKGNFQRINTPAFLALEWKETLQQRPQTTN